MSIVMTYMFTLTGKEAFVLYAGFQLRLAWFVLLFMFTNVLLVTYFSSQGQLLLNSSLPPSSNATCNVSSIVADA